LLPAPAAGGTFPTLSLRILPCVPGPLSRRSRGVHLKNADESILGESLVQNPEGQQIKQQPSLKDKGKKAEIPVVYVVFEPTELIEVQGEPKYNPTLLQSVCCEAACCWLRLS
jgi:hypothetical protein